MSYTVLIVDDSAAVRQKVQEVLRGDPMVGAIITAADGIEGFKHLLATPVDLVLCDVVMPTLDGFKFLGLKNSRPELRELPVIMLTGEEDVRAKVRGLDAGASDYLTKPFDNQELLARVRVHLKLKGLQNELREKNVRLEQLTRTDELTQLNNRRFFMEMLSNEFRRSERYGTPFVYVMGDVDFFKKVNDVHGHVVGDRALQTVAQAMVHTARAQDILGRYGGEEFAILMPHTERKGGELAAERHRRQVASATIPIDAGVLQVTISLGIADYPRPDIHRVEDLIAMADAALYRAKEQGRNRVVLCPPAQSVAGQSQELAKNSA